MGRNMFIDYLNKDRIGEQRLDAAATIVNEHKELAKNLENRIRSNTLGGPLNNVPGGASTPGNSVQPTGVIPTNNQPGVVGVMGLASPVSNHIPNQQVLRTISGNPNNAVAPANVVPNSNQNNNNAVFQLIARSRNSSNSEPNIYDSVLKDREASPLVGSKNV